MVGRDLQTHSLIGVSLLVILGVQAVSFGICARVYNVYFVGGEDRLPSARSRLRLEHGLVLAALFVRRARPLGRGLGKVGSRGFGALREERLAIVAATVIAVGAQVFFTSFLLSILGLRWRSAS